MNTLEILLNLAGRRQETQIQLDSKSDQVRRQHSFQNATGMLRHCNIINFTTGI